MAVEAGVVSDERRTHRRGEPKPVPGAVRIRSQGEVARELMDVARAQLRIAAEPAGREHGRARGQRERGPVCLDDLRAA